MASIVAAYHTPEMVQSNHSSGDPDDAWLEHDWERQYSYVALSVGFGLIALIALVQLIRIQMRVPEYGWTTQKVFHLMNCFCATYRCIVFAVRKPNQDLSSSDVLTTLWLDLPGLLFFSTYTLLVLFWAEIYHQARSLPTNMLRPTFTLLNGLVYALQIATWIYMMVGTNNHEESDTLRTVTASFYAVVYFAAGCGFTVYGGRLFVMLRRFPVQSPGRRKKLKEVGSVTSVCTTCFLARAIVVAYAAYKKTADLDNNEASDAVPMLNFFYYVFVEIIPSALVLWILRKLPPKRTNNGYHQIS